MNHQIKGLSSALDEVHWHQHQARLECLERCLEQMSLLHTKWELTNKSLPIEINHAIRALMAAYHAELQRRVRRPALRNQAGTLKKQSDG